MATHAEEFDRPGGSAAQSSPASTTSEPPTPQATGPDYTAPEWAAQPPKGYALEVRRAADEAERKGRKERERRERRVVAQTACALSS